MGLEVRENFFSLWQGCPSQHRCTPPHPQERVTPGERYQTLLCPPTSLITNDCQGLGGLLAGDFGVAVPVLPKQSTRTIASRDPGSPKGPGEAGGGSEALQEGRDGGFQPLFHCHMPLIKAHPAQVGSPPTAPVIRALATSSLAGGQWAQWVPCACWRVQPEARPACHRRAGLANAQLNQVPAKDRLVQGAHSPGKARTQSSPGLQEPPARHAGLD